ncbi:GspH/FimT family pseudopilin [Pseudomonas chengduensis]|jgi:type II secretion system protein H|uniref:GspH/FimT family pseudopilin n=1 Tax=Ectopseudomonas toyotomiensis TaxID=554344 RepID=UPI000891BD27|nr:MULTISPECIES: GspH/FimT family pseudopilin [Pseudomonas]MDH1730980.1 GspH/FimT family pseudopilin [Pseudomonas chengduensis]WKC35332.1 GspH/FimT family pseudopilin [Pseudomonas chengduensis]SDA52896.1 type IV fimbrial biogenesis protein FimU [Pseudomonas sp. NFPP33]
MPNALSHSSRNPAIGLSAQGFSLIELLIILILIGIFAAIAMPNLQQLIASNRVQSAADDLTSQLQYARSEAVVRNRLVIVENTSGQSNRWDQGLRIFVAGNATANRAYNASVDTELRSHNGSGQPKLTANSTSDAATWISFRPNGTLAATTAQQIILCEDDLLSLAKVIEIQPSGRISMPTTAPTTCSP